MTVERITGGEGIIAVPTRFLRNWVATHYTDRLLTLWERSRSDGLQSTVAPANFYDWREQSRSFGKMAAIDPCLLHVSDLRCPSALASEQSEQT